MMKRLRKYFSGCEENDKTDCKTKENIIRILNSNCEAYLHNLTIVMHYFFVTMKPIAILFITCFNLHKKNLIRY